MRDLHILDKNVFLFVDTMRGFCVACRRFHTLRSSICHPSFGLYLVVDGLSPTIVEFAFSYYSAHLFQRLFPRDESADGYCFFMRAFPEAFNAFALLYAVPVVGRWLIVEPVFDALSAGWVPKRHAVPARCRCPFPLWRWSDRFARSLRSAAIL